MLNSFEIAGLLADQYAGVKESFDFMESGAGNRGVCWATTRRGDIDYVLLRGSSTFQDWCRDFLAVVLPFSHSRLGPVHPGFMEGVAEAWTEIRAKTKGPWVVAGHSLGAGRAAVLSGLMKADGCAPLKRFGFGEPKPGFEKLREFLADVPAEVYRNGNGKHHDLVTDVPLTFPPEEYVHSTDLRTVTACPPSSDQWGPFSWHHIELYRDAVKGL